MAAIYMGPNTTFAGRLKKLNSIQREGIRIYTGAFRSSWVEALYVEANDPLLELRMNELGLRFLYKLKSNSSYIYTLNTLDDIEDENYENLRRLEQIYIYMEEEKETDETNQTQ